MIDEAQQFRRATIKYAGRVKNSDDHPAIFSFDTGMLLTYFEVKWEWDASGGNWWVNIRNFGLRDFLSAGPKNEGTRYRFDQEVITDVRSCLEELFLTSEPLPFFPYNLPQRGRCLGVKFDAEWAVQPSPVSDTGWLSYLKRRFR